MHRTFPTVLLLATAAATAQAPAPFDFDAAFAEAQPPPVEARWTLIPWRHSLTDALDEAKQTKRPVYLYVNDGDVDSGRC
jgi:hypothetical protein